MQVLNRELAEANNVLRAKRSEVQRIEEEVALLMQVWSISSILIDIHPGVPRLLKSHTLGQTAEPSQIPRMPARSTACLQILQTPYVTAETV